MRAAWLWMALALLGLGGCGKVRPCKSGTLLLSVSLEGGAANADQLLVTISVGGVPGEPQPVGLGGGRGGTIEVRFTAYPAGGQVAVSIAALRGGAVIGQGASGPRTAAPGCDALAITVGDPSADLSPPGDQARADLVVAAEDAMADLGAPDLGQLPDLTEAPAADASPDLPLDFAVAPIPDLTAAPACDDGRKNGDETDLDCGGKSCKPCPDGKGCRVGADCTSSVCAMGACAAPSCTDKVKNGPETDVDCGGKSCKPCPDGGGCQGAADCASAVCSMNRCAAPSCADKTKNGDETDVDCGGKSCKPCPDGKGCQAPADCTSGICASGACAAAGCVDLVKNGDETDVDCGGKSCRPCGDGKGCQVPGDCASSVCGGGACATPSCGDRVKNGDEVDLDCGGPKCPGCDNGRACAMNRDCQSGYCATNRCAAKKAVSSACADTAECSGGNAACLPRVGNVSAFGGYCSNQPCANNNDCGNLGFCPGNGINFCLMPCQAAGECQKVNPDNRCFWSLANGMNACLPSGYSSCDPTSAASCNNTGDCYRSGPDNVGYCLMPCQFGQACPNDAQGNPQACMFFNAKVDGNGNPTADVFQGLACFYRGNNLGLGAACNFLNECQEGLECDFFRFGGAKACRALCLSGVQQGQTGACPQGSTCRDAFKLGARFVFGAVGLCL